MGGKSWIGSNTNFWIHSLKVEIHSVRRDPIILYGISDIGRFIMNKAFQIPPSSARLGYISGPNSQKKIFQELLFLFSHNDEKKDTSRWH